MHGEKRADRETQTKKENVLFAKELEASLQALLIFAPVVKETEVLIHGRNHQKRAYQTSNPPAIDVLAQGQQPSQRIVINAKDLVGLIHGINHAPPQAQTKNLNVLLVKVLVVRHHPHLQCHQDTALLPLALVFPCPELIPIPQDIIQERQPQEWVIQERQDLRIQEPRDMVIQERQDLLIQEPREWVIQERQDLLIQEPQEWVIQERQPQALTHAHDARDKAALMQQ